jgi:hypothetical protein
LITSAIPDSPEWHRLGVEEEVKAAGSMADLESELRALANKKPDLLKHVTWKAHQRRYLMSRHANLKPHEALWQLDYGGLTDSAGRKVNVWSCTTLPHHHHKQSHFDFFFDSANQRQDAKQDGPGHKKDGQAGIFFLGELLDKHRHPTRPGETSVLSEIFPETTHLILSGDTGNGYRAYEMLEELSKLANNYGFTCELIPLAPGHAYNRTDTRIAHMNTFMRSILRSSRVRGAKAVATAFAAASDEATANRRKFMRGSPLALVDTAN